VKGERSEKQTPNIEHRTPNAKARKLNAQRQIILSSSIED